MEGLSPLREALHDDLQFDECDNLGNDDFVELEKMLQAWDAVWMGGFDLPKAFVASPTPATILTVQSAASAPAPAPVTAAASEPGPVVGGIAASLAAAAAAANSSPPTTSSSSSASQHHGTKQRSSSEQPWPGGQCTSTSCSSITVHTSAPMPASTSAAASTEPVTVGMSMSMRPADRPDFSHVFFSPLQHTLLGLGRSCSNDNLAGNMSVGSPGDVTLRGGRMSFNSSTLADWPEGSDDVSSATDNSPTAGEVLGACPPSPSQFEADTTTHGIRNARYHTAKDLIAAALPGGGLEPRTSTEEAPSSSSTAASNDSSTANTSGAGPGQGKLPAACTMREQSISPDSVLVNALDTDTASTQPSTSITSSSATAISTSPPIRIPGPPSFKSSMLKPSTPPAMGMMPAFTSHPAIAGMPRGSPPERQQHLHLHGDADAELVQPAVLCTTHVDFTRISIGPSIAAVAEASARKAAPGPMLKLVAGAAMIPHVDKADKGGEDAYCICTTGLGSIVVADGVSGWAEEGIDPAEYSRTLVRHTSQALETGKESSAREVIRYAHSATYLAGSSTVCVAVMKPNGRLEVANLGDSGVRVVRNGRIIFASTAQQHMFNMPFQLSHPSIIESPDDADSADVSLIDMQPGDLLIMATDGLYDNMFDEEIAQMCDAVMSKRPPGVPMTQQEAEELAMAISNTAHRYAQDPNQKTPWSVTSVEQGYFWAHHFAKGGGKMDDVTVIVAYIDKA